MKGRGLQPPYETILLARCPVACNRCQVIYHKKKEEQWNIACVDVIHMLLHHNQNMTNQRLALEDYSRDINPESQKSKSFFRTNEVNS
jgi:hypothetical protein